MDRRTYLATVAGGVLSVGVAGCADSSAADEDYDVGMTPRRFEPETIQVTPGTTVAWKNTSGVPHTVTARETRIPDDAAFFASGGFESQAAAERAWREDQGGGLSEGESYEYEFTSPGEYAYFCIPHDAAGMVGVVSVQYGESDP